MVPTDDFREHQLRVLPRAAAVMHRRSDPERAQRNRLGIRVLEIDGTDDAEAVADVVAEHFSP